MSEEVRTKKEIEVDILLKKAEIKKVEGEARKAEAEAYKEELEAKKAKEDYEKRLAGDKENFLYRFSGDVRGSSVNACMTTLTQWARRSPKCDIEIVFSSPGGSIIDGFELFDFLQDLRGRGHKVTTGSLGMAASMAGILLQAGEVRWIGHQAWVMIHRAAFGAIGKTFEIEDEVKYVKRIEERCLGIFTSRSKLTKQKIKRNWDRKDWWIDADEWLAMGLVDEIRGMMPEAEAKVKEKVKRNAKSRAKNNTKSKKRSKRSRK